MPILLDSLPMPTRNFFHFFDREHGRRFVLHNRAFSSGGGGFFLKGSHPVDTLVPDHLIKYMYHYLPIRTSGADGGQRLTWLASGLLR